MMAMLGFFIVEQWVGGKSQAIVCVRIFSIVQICTFLHVFIVAQLFSCCTRVFLCQLSPHKKYRMQNSEKLCLKWNDFQENLNSSLGVLRNDQDFADVTLVCEDGTQIGTHRVILVSSSPFFMDMLRKNNHPHPMIYMRGLRGEA